MTLEQSDVERIAWELQEGSAPEDFFTGAKRYHPADIAHILDLIDDETKVFNIFLSLDKAVSSETLAYLSDDKQASILEKSSPGDIAQVIEEMDSDDAADALGEVDESVAEKILSEADAEVEEEVSRLMEFAEDTAGGIMQTELFATFDTDTVGAAISQLHKKTHELGEVHNIFLTDKSFRLTGAVNIRKLILNPPDTPLSRLKDEDIHFVTVDTDQEKVAGIFQRYDLISLPVVDSERKLLGRIVVDDIVDVMQEEASEDILKMAGANDEALIQGHSVAEMARYRFPWLASSLLSGLLTGVIIMQFEATIAESIALTAFIPVVMGISGNVGVQSSALIIRGMTTGKVNINALKKYFVKEIKVALLLGVLCGSLAGIAANYWQGSFDLGLVVGVSIFISILFAALMGTAIPIFFRWMKIDPAIAGGPMVLAVNDLSGILIFFVVASAMLTYL